MFTWIFPCPAAGHPGTVRPGLRSAAPLAAALCLAALVITAPPLHAQFEWTASRPDGHAPIGVMGEHTHSRGEWMQSMNHGNPMMAPTVREALRGGTRLDLPLGLNILFPGGALKGHRIAAEWHIPLYQNLNGPQIETDWLVTVGWQKSFEPLGHH